MSIEKEKKIVELMIKLYCHKKENNKELCRDCRALLDYARHRLEHCRYGNNKTSCKRCPTHCYKPEMRARIREVMRFSGPRMLLYAPVTAIKHLLSK